MCSCGSRSTVLHGEHLHVNILPIFYILCAGLKVNLGGKLTPHKSLVRDFKMELQFTSKVKIKPKSQSQPVGWCGGSNPIEWWLQSHWRDGCGLATNGGPVERPGPSLDVRWWWWRILVLWMSSGGCGVPKTRLYRGMNVWYLSQGRQFHNGGCNSMSHSGESLKVHYQRWSPPPGLGGAATSPKRVITVE